MTHSQHPWRRLPSRRPQRRLRCHLSNRVCQSTRQVPVVRFPTNSRRAQENEGCFPPLLQVEWFSQHCLRNNRSKRDEIHHLRREFRKWTAMRPARSLFERADHCTCRMPSNRRSRRSSRLLASSRSSFGTTLPKVGPTRSRVPWRPALSRLRATVSC